MLFVVYKVLSLWETHHLWSFNQLASWLLRLAVVQPCVVYQFNVVNHVTLDALMCCICSLYFNLPALHGVKWTHLQFVARKCRNNEKNVFCWTRCSSNPFALDRTKTTSFDVESEMFVTVATVWELPGGWEVQPPSSFLQPPSLIYSFVLGGQKITPQIALV